MSKLGVRTACLSCPFQPHALTGCVAPCSQVSFELGRAYGAATCVPAHLRRRPRWHGWRRLDQCSDLGHEKCTNSVALAGARHEGQQWASKLLVFSMWSIPSGARALSTRAYHPASAKYIRASMRRREMCVLWLVGLARGPAVTSPRLYGRFEARNAQGTGRMTRMPETRGAGLCAV